MKSDPTVAVQELWSGNGGHAGRRVEPDFFWGGGARTSLALRQRVAVHLPLTPVPQSLDDGSRVGTRTGAITVRIIVAIPCTRNLKDKGELDDGGRSCVAGQAGKQQ